MDTFDFKLEIHKIQEKISLLADVKNIIKNESKINQSVELLELIHNRITEMSNPEKNGKAILIQTKWATVYRVCNRYPLGHENDAV